jgi:hypothetical protein
MDGNRREKIEEEISKLPKNQRKALQSTKKGSKKDTAIGLLIQMGVYGGVYGAFYGGIALIKYLWG